MSYAVDQPRRRPGVVTAASILLFVAAVALLVEAVVLFTQIGPVGDELAPIYPPDEYAGSTDSGRSVARGLFGVPATGALVFALILVGLGALLLIGKNWARISTWVFGGLGMLCCGCTSAIYAGLGLTNLAAQVESQSGSNANTPGPTTEEFTAALDRAIPESFTMTLIGLGSVIVLSLLATVILLALPAAGDFFRKQAIIWVPPTAAGPAPAAWSGYGPPPTDLPNPPSPPGAYPPPASPPGGYPPASPPGGYPPASPPGATPSAPPGATPPPGAASAGPGDKPEEPKP